MGSPVQPLFDWRNKYVVQPLKALHDFSQHPVDTVENWIRPAPQQAPPMDTSWHDQMVRQANQSFQPQGSMISARKKK